LAGLRASADDRRNWNALDATPDAPERLLARKHQNLDSTVPCPTVVIIVVDAGPRFAVPDGGDLDPVELSSSAQVLAHSRRTPLRQLQVVGVRAHVVCVASDLQLDTLESAEIGDESIHGCKRLTLEGRLVEVEQHGALERETDRRPDRADGVDVSARPAPGTALRQILETNELKGLIRIDRGDWHIPETWVYATGKPYTEPVELETVERPFGTFDRVLVGAKNGARLPAYHRLDVALNREFPIVGTGGKGLFGLTLFNLYNRENTWYKEFNVVEGEIIENNINLMGLTVNASVSVTF
jgi:hypothetical protein